MLRKVVYHYWLRNNFLQEIVAFSTYMNRDTCFVLIFDKNSMLLSLLHPNSKKQNAIDVQINMQLGY